MWTKVLRSCDEWAAGTRWGCTGAADGQVFACMRCSGTMVARGIRLGNVFEEGLPRPLREGARHNMVHATVGDR